MEFLTLTDMEARLIDRPQTARQVSLYKGVLKDHPDAIVAIVGDEQTGQRFGNANRRRGMCLKLGGAHACRTFTGRPYQAWATWSPLDISDFLKQ